MSEYIICGGNALNGTVAVSGSKNAALPILCATLLCSDGTVTLNNCPDITDVHYTLNILSCFGCETEFVNGTVTVNAQNAKFCKLPFELTSKMRSASLFLGASLGRFNKATSCRSGGCELGQRPIDMHLKGFEKMGVSVSEAGDCIMISGTPHGTDVFLRYPSVGATENVMLAAVLAKGTTTITNAAREPEIVDLQNFLNAMGAKIHGAGGSTVIIEGIEKLNGIVYNIMGDRIEAATYLAGAIATDGCVTVTGIDPNCLTAVTDVIINSGGCVCRRPNSITVRRGGQFVLSPTRIETAPYPGFPTDAQSVFMAMLLKSQGITEICERVFSDRLRVVSEFLKMGAVISVSGDTAQVCGAETLYGACLFAGDLRSGAALVIAALSAVGESTVKNIAHIERGYQNFESKLCSLGANIKKINGD